MMRMEMQMRMQQRKPKRPPRQVKFVDAHAGSWFDDENHTGGFIVQLPVRVVSEANLREHWAKHDKRRAEQMQAVKFACSKYGRDLRGHNRYAVRLLRYGPHKLDGDNLQRAFKAVRDAVAWCLDIDDGDERITWTYAQQIGRAYGIEIRVEAT